MYDHNNYIMVSLRVLLCWVVMVLWQPLTELSTSINTTTRIMMIHAWTPQLPLSITVVSNTIATTTTTTSRSRSIVVGRDPTVTAMHRIVDHPHHFASGRSCSSCCSSRTRSFVPGKISTMTTTSSSLSSSTSSSSSDLNIDTTSISSGTANDENTKRLLLSSTDLTEEQRNFVMGYINQHHTSTFNIPIVTTFSPIGIEMAQANVWSGGSYSIVTALLTNVVSILTTTTTTTTIDTSSKNQGWMEFNVTIQRRSQPLPEYRHVRVALDAIPTTRRKNEQVRGNGNVPSSQASASSGFRMIPTTPIDELVRCLCRMCDIIQQPTLTGKFVQLALQLQGIGIGKLPENMYVSVCVNSGCVSSCAYICVFVSFVG